MVPRGKHLIACVMVIGVRVSLWCCVRGSCVVKGVSVHCAISSFVYEEAGGGGGGRGEV